MITTRYFENIEKVLHTICTAEKESIKKAAETAAKVIKNDGIIYVFGCGHSHLAALDSFYRAGGLANVSAVLDSDLMLHNGAAKSSIMEKLPGLASGIFERYCMNENDVFIIISTSGKNAVPVEMALEAKMHKVKTIGIASSEYLKKNVHGKKMLADCVDLYIDNHIPYGDVSVEIGHCKMGSMSTFAGSFIIQSALMEAAHLLYSSGYTDIPVYMSGNAEGGTEYNKEIVKHYLPKIKHL